MVARNPHAPSTPAALSRAAAIAAFRKADRDADAAIVASIDEKFRISAASGIHFDELERLIGNGPRDAVTASPQPSAPVASAAQAPARAPRRRPPTSVPTDATLPNGAAMPAPPPALAKHPSVQAAFRRGVVDAFGRAPSCPYGDTGIAKACGRAWAEGLRAGRALGAKS